jgi:Uncharacterized protein conserved in bacteria (DUF2330)
MWLGWIAHTAHAFCGTYVGSPGVSLVNRTSQVVIARQGTRTTLTLMADYEGELADFALLIPVPESLDPSGVTVVDPAVIDRLDQYSTPRLVQYTCDTALTSERVGTVGCSGAAVTLGGCGGEQSATGTWYGSYPGEISLTAAAATVTVEASFRLAQYDVVLLGADGADGLYAWLELNGFAVPPGGDDILQDYIDDGVHFLAAKVHLDDVPPEGVTRLSPLQLRYESEAWELPIRIGTISGTDEQEVIVYAITDVTAGDVQITNFPEREVEDECMWPSAEWDSFSAFYQDRLRSTMRGELPEEPPTTPGTTAPPPSGTTPSVGEPSELGWVTEYNWTLYQLVGDTGYHCDPCTVEIEDLYDPGELADLGFADTVDTLTGSGTYGTNGAVAGGALLTRLRLVYDPASVVDDLALHTTGFHAVNRQIRYIEYDRQLEFLFPVCGEGFAAEPGVCGDDLDPGQRGGASRVPLPLALFGGALLLASARRRWS